jgi:hypothetical protein
MQAVDRGIRTVLLVLVVICSLGLLSLAFRNTGVVFDLPLTEDGYYTLTVARNIARGVGFSVDGKTLTNGFQPLWGIVSSLFFLVTGESNELSIRFVLLASAMLAILSAFLWSSLAAGLLGVEGSLYRVCFIVIYLTSFQLLAQHFNGLETGLVLVLQAVLGLYWCSSSDPPLRRAVILGLMIGVLVVARIDTGIFAVLLALEMLWRGRRDPRLAFVQVLVMTAMATLIAAPWFIYNVLLTGHVMPVSGLALGIGPDGPFARVANAVGAIARDGFPNIMGELNRRVDLAIMVVAFGLAVYLLRRQGSRPSRSPPDGESAVEFRRRCRTYMAMIAIYLAIQIVFYTIFNIAAFFYNRYFILLAVLAVTVFAYLLYRLAASRGGWLAAVVGVALAGTGLSNVLGCHGVDFGHQINRWQTERNGPCLEQVALAEQVRKPGEIVGAIQTGTLGFFVEGTINLDGRVNYAAYQARRAGKLVDYILAQRIGLLVDYDIYLTAKDTGYFPPSDDPARYFTKVAQEGPTRPYGWIAMRRRTDAAAAQSSLEETGSASALPAFRMR